MSKYYNKEIPTEINIVYGGRQSGKTYYELMKLKEENKKLNELVQFNVKTTATLTKRINKAIEYIEELYTRYIADYSDIERLEKILKGEEKDEN